MASSESVTGSALAALVRRAAADADAPPTRLGLYVHVPFCASRCTYCDFYRTTSATDGAMRDYLASLAAQVTELAPILHANAIGVSTVYVGGGTPSALGARLAPMIQDLLTALPVTAGSEVTVECNPDDIDAALVRDLVAAGVNRFSLGVQALDDAVLQQFNRRHDADGARAAIRVLVSSGARVSVDLLAGVPGVTDATFESWLTQVCDLGVGHVSIYPLSVEEHTPLAASIERGELPDTDPDAAARQMELAARVLSVRGIDRYEVANYAIPGQESVHNSSYWTGVDYVGLGPSAASMVNVDGRVRTTLHDSLAAYAADPLCARPAEIETLSRGEARREDVMLGLRLACGVTADHVEAAGVMSVVASLVDEGLLTYVDGGSITTTPRGWLLGNEVFGRILFD